MTTSDRGCWSSPASPATGRRAATATPSLLTSGSTSTCGELFCLWACVGAQIFFLAYCFSGNPLYDPQCYIPYFMSCIAVIAICGIDGKRKNGEAYGNLQ